MPYISAVNDRISAVLDGLADELPGIAHDVAQMIAPARVLLSGGKRSRARLSVLGWSAVTGESEPEHPALPIAGSALEFFQAAALVHDDLIDDADTRRGRPAVHRQFEAQHADADLLGEAREFGSSAAILAGDLLLSLGQREISAAVRATEGAGDGALAVWDAMCAEVAIGQYLDIRASMLPLPREGDSAGFADALERAVTVERHKSARYSVVHPLELGARLAGGSDDVVARLRAVSEPLGEAFQLRDDELGIFGDPARTGKPAGDDLIEGKRTPLVLLGLSMTSGEDHSAILDSLRNENLTHERVADVRRILCESGAYDAHERLIAERTEASTGALAACDLVEPVREQLAASITALTQRDR